jgi:hypothetical protein
MALPQVSDARTGFAYLRLQKLTNVSAAVGRLVHGSGGSAREAVVMLDRSRNAPAPKHRSTRHRTAPVPRTMFAAAIDRFGGPDEITGHALPVPPLDAGEVLIAVDTAGVKSRRGSCIRDGLHRVKSTT